MAREAREAVIETLLLEREDPNTTHPVDAQHWIAIYSQLIDFKYVLLERGRRELLKLDPEAIPTAQADIALLEGQLQHLQHRRQAWLDRERKLRGLTLDFPSRTVSFQGQSIDMSRREIELLDALLRRGGRPTPARILIADAWNDSALTSEQLRLYIARLRAKLAPMDSLEIRHEPRRGYALVFKNKS